MSESMELYTDTYFTRTRDLLKKQDLHPSVVMQVFQKHEAILCGVKEVSHLFEGSIPELDELEIDSLKDGDWIRPYESVMHITGDYSIFAHLETVYLGILARSTMIATNTRRCVHAAKGTPVFFMGARHTHYATQKSDGYAAKIGGAKYVGTAMHGKESGDAAMGTMPHALIAVFDGDMTAACWHYARAFEGPVAALVDFNNDCVGDSLKAAKVLGDRLAAVRLDTSANLIDKSLEWLNQKNLGVTTQLVWNVRKALDSIDRQDVKIIVSGGFNPDKINQFEGARAPVDMYGVGSWIVQGENDFTADLVLKDGKTCGKVGRSYKALDRKVVTV